MRRSTRTTAPIRRRANDYLIDREAQKRESFTHIKGISEQDQAVQDSQGLIHDRTREMLESDRPRRLQLSAR